MSVVLLLGAGLGLGVTLLVRSLRPRPPGLRGALAALDRPGPVRSDDRPSRRRAKIAALSSWAADRAPAADLELVGRTPERHAVRKLSAAMTLAALPAAASGVSALAGVGVRPGAVAMVSLCLALIGFVTPDIELRGLAAERRAEFVHALSSFLDVTAVLLAGGAGTESALHAAASLGDAWPQQRLRAALDRCRLTGQTPWEVLGLLGDRLQIDELSQLATSLQLAGEQGARVRITLTERARALRSAQLTAVETRARAVTEQMSVPVALLAVAFMLFVGFPAVWVVLGEL
ncbi:MAG TPA: type II secretion system F family protein [Euzebyales bacterium]|nr:type II secretion system F family protein [Euzebyales bacterium]